MTVDRLKFFGGRVGGVSVVLVVLGFVVFCLQRYTPADPVRVKLGANAQPQIVKAERHRLGYDRPLFVQYFDYVKGLAHGDLQDSLRTRNPVTTDLGNYVPATLELTGFALGLALVLGPLLGIASPPRLRGSSALPALIVAASSPPPL